MKKVRIKGMVTTSQYGTLESGRVYEFPAAFAAHLVNDANAAEYVEDDEQAKADAQAKAQAEADAQAKAQAEADAKAKATKKK